MAIVKILSRLFLMLFSIIGLTACRDYYLNYFEVVRIDSVNTSLKIELIPTRVVKDSPNKIAIEGFPYTLKFNLISDDKVESFSINNVIARNEGANSFVELGPVANDRGSWFDDDKYGWRIVYSRVIDASNFNYENLLLTVDYQYQIKGEVYSFKKDVEVKLNKKKEKRTDIALP
ncbi:MAG: hypothetical protein U5M23_00825 [Marinagarivorans sp.]|nr:hypothetical protein [Marinagarivorans sp.]